MPGRRIGPIGGRAVVVDIPLAVHLGLPFAIGRDVARLAGNPGDVAIAVKPEVTEHSQAADGLIVERPRAYVIDYGVDAASGTRADAIRIRAIE